MKKLLTVVLAVILALSVCACGSTTTNDASGNAETKAEAVTYDNETVAEQASGESAVIDKLTYGQKTNSWDVSPWMNNGSGGGTVYTLLYAFVMSAPEIGSLLDEMEYDMAESYELSSDKLTCTVKLRDYIHDNQGNEIKADDVVFCYQTAPEVSGTHAAINNYLDSVKKVDDLTVEFKIKAYSPGAWEYVLGNCEIISKSWYEKSTEEDRSMNPAVTGPYYVKENVPGTSVTFAVNEDFWQKDELRTTQQTVTAKEIVMLGMGEDTMRSIALDNNEIDLTRLENVTTASYMDSDDFTVYPLVVITCDSLFLNCSEGSKFDNADLRKAIWYALDYEQIKIAAIGDFGFRTHDITSKYQNGYNDEWDDEPYYELDLDLAKEYLEKAGYDENSGLEINFLCKATDPQKAAAVVIQQNLSKIGIKVNINAYEQNLLDTYTADATAWDMVWLAPDLMTGIISEPWNYFFGVNESTGRTISFVDDDVLNEKMNAVLTDFSTETIEDFHDYEVEMAYGVSMWNAEYYATCRKGITGITWNPTGNIALNRLLYAEDYVPVQ